MVFHSSFAWLLGSLQILLLVLFFVGTEYNASQVYSHDQYAVFRDIMVMLLLGFGYLMTFLHKYGLGAVGMTMMLTVLAIQLNLFVEPLMRFVYYGHEPLPIPLDLPAMINGEFS